MYIPSKDSLLRNWSDNFRNLIVATPGAFGLEAADAAIIDNYVDLYLTAYSLAVDPSTRTPSTVAEKDARRVALLDIVRPYAQSIKKNLGISNEQRTELGLNIDDLSKSPILAPASQPILAVVAAQALEHTLRFADTATPAARRKPPGAIGLQLFVAIAATGTPTVEDAEFKAFITRQPFAVEFLQADVGKTAWYWGRWQTARGLTSPWSDSASMTVAA